MTAGFHTTFQVSPLLTRSIFVSYDQTTPSATVQLTFSVAVALSPFVVIETFASAALAGARSPASLLSWVQTAVWSSAPPPVSCSCSPSAFPCAQKSANLLTASAGVGFELQAVAPVRT